MSSLSAPNYLCDLFAWQPVEKSSESWAFSYICGCKKEWVMKDAKGTVNRFLIVLYPIKTYQDQGWTDREWQGGY